MPSLLPVFFMILRPPFWAKCWAIYSCHHDVYNDETWYDDDDEWWLVQVDGETLTCKKRDIKEENFGCRKMWWTHKRCITLQKCNKFLRRSPFMMATLRFLFSACGEIKNCFVALRSCVLRGLALESIFVKWTPPDEREREKIVIPQHWLKQTNGQRWRIELFFFEVVSWKIPCSIFFSFLTPQTQLNRKSQNYSRFLTLHKNHGYQKRKSLNSFIFGLMMFLMAKHVIVKSQKYLVRFFLEIKIVSSFCSKFFVLFLGNKMKCVRWNWKPGNEVSHMHHSSDTHIFFVVQRNNISDIKFEIKYHGKAGGGEARKER